MVDVEDCDTILVLLENCRLKILQYKHKVAADSTTISYISVIISKNAAIRVGKPRTAKHYKYHVRFIMYKTQVHKAVE